jgi:hypothetical protein
MSTPECLLFMCISVGNVAQNLTEWGEHDMDDIFLSSCASDLVTYITPGFIY